jgi:serine protease Do
MMELYGVKTGRMSMMCRTVVFTYTLVLAAMAGLVGANAFMPQSWRAQFNAAVIHEFVAQAQPGPADFADVVQAVKPAVIGVRTKVIAERKHQLVSKAQLDQFPRRGRPEHEPDIPNIGKRLTGQEGSGFFLSADGYAVTNSSVVEGSDTAEIQTDDSRIYRAKVVGTDPASNLALLKVDGRDDFPYVQLADKAPRVGDWVLAVGNPFGLGNTVTAGIVSARERNMTSGTYQDLIQMDASVNPGDAGGPSFDLNGNVIGVNAMIFSPSGGSIGIAFAIPADTVKTVVPQLKDKGSVARGWMGVQIMPVTPDIADRLRLEKALGAIIGELEPDGPAAKAGIASGDIITSVNGEPIKDAHDLVKRIGGMTPGASVGLGVLRNGQEQTIPVTLGELPVKRQARGPVKEQNPPSGGTSGLGLKLASVGNVSGAETKGVVITAIDPNGSAAARGIETGDVILAVSGQAVSTPVEVQNALSKARGEDKKFVLVQLMSGETTRFVAVPADPM